MFVPIVFIIILAVSISRHAKTKGVSSTKPLLVALGVYLVMVVATSGAIKVRSMSDMGPALLGGLAMYGVAFAVIYAVARAWINGAAGAADVGDAGAGGLTTLKQHIQRGVPTNITCIADSTKLDVLRSFYEERVAAPDAQRLKHHLLVAASGDRRGFPILIASTGELGQHHKGYDATSIRDKVVSGEGWGALWGDGVEDRANFAQRGCVLETTAYFDEVAGRILADKYQLVQVFSPVEGA